MLRKNNPSLRHRVIDARAGEDQAIRAAERRDHDRQRHQRRAAVAENRGQRRGGDAIVRRRLNLVQRQRRKIANIGQEIERDDDRRAHGERNGNIALRIFHFARRKRDVVPGVGGKKRSHLRDAERDEQTERARCGRHRGDERFHPVRARLDGLRIVKRPDAAEIGVNRRGVASQKNSRQDQRGKRPAFSPK